MLLKISFSFPEIDTPVAVHNIRNFAEDLERELCSTQTGHVLNIDSVTTEVIVDVKSRRHLGNISQLIKKCLKQNGLLDIATFH